MRNLLRFVIKNYAFLLFLLLEVISFALIFNYNSYQKSKYLNSSGRMVASVYSTFSNIRNYFSLAEINMELAEENARMQYLLSNVPNYVTAPDSVLANLEKGNSAYRFIPAKVINNSVNKQNNYITLNKGRRHGIKVDQGILNGDGVVGVITNVSDSYSMGFSLLNKRWGVSAKLKSNGTFGPISWDGTDARFVDLNGIPFHVELAVGDTVVTSSYSSIFPEGLIIGKVHSFEQPQGENYFKIKVELEADFYSLSYVIVVDNVLKNEISNLEKFKINDSGSD